MKKEGGVCTNRGQVSLVLLLVVVIVLLFVFVAVMRVRVEPRGVQEVVAQARSLVASCLEQALVVELERTSVQGGFVILPVQSINLPYGVVGVFSNGSSFLGPSLQQTATDLSARVPQAVRECVSSSGFVGSVAVEDLRVTVSFSDSAVIAVMKGRVAVSRGSDAGLVDEVVTTVPVRYRVLHGYAVSIAKMMADDPWGIDLSALAGLDVAVDVIPIQPGIVGVYLSDPSSRVSGRPYVFSVVIAREPAQGFWGALQSTMSRLEREAQDGFGVAR